VKDIGKKEGPALARQSKDHHLTNGNKARKKKRRGGGENDCPWFVGIESLVRGAVRKTMKKKK